jgi:NAD(P)-dependent dehydrogenase (short-subunit alcohol dehydrogenase family)
VTLVGIHPGIISRGELTWQRLHSTFLFGQLLCYFKINKGVFMGFDLDNIPNQQGKIAVVTGANAGLGLETTLYLAKKGIKVVMACRNQQKAELAKANILEKVPNANLEIMTLDLSKLSSVREFAANYRKQYSSIDLLINNAGIMFAPFSKTEDELESQMAANYFGHFLLTSLLIDLMPDSSESRVVSLSSVAHKQGMRKINFDDINFDKKYSRTGAYSQSKLACLMFALELQRRFSQQGKKILSVVAHPGASDTELTKYIPPFLASILRYTIVPFVTHTPDQAALPTLMATLDENVQGGDYYGPQGFKEMKGPPGKATMSQYAQDAEMAKKLWRVSEELTGAKY